MREAHLAGIGVDRRASANGSSKNMAYLTCLVDGGDEELVRICMRTVVMVRD